MPPLITLLTDFGCQDNYVGVMKGVIAGICPEAKLIDLSHSIPPQDVAAARFALLSAYPYFPEGTIHLCVVDPGVGTNRRAIAIQTAKAFLVGPDNGVFSGVLDQEKDIRVVSLTQAQYWRTSTLSATFHGRDLFAPVAAHLAMGVCLTSLGSEIAPDSLTRPVIPQPEVTEDQILGTIQYIDRFGNGITTIPAPTVEPLRWQVQMETGIIPLAKTYSDVGLGEAIALVGSHGWVEIAVNGGSARLTLGLAIGDEIRLIPKPR